MSGPPRVRSMNVATTTETESRPVLGPAGNKTRFVDTQKPALKPQRTKVEKRQPETESNEKKPMPPPSILRRQGSTTSMLSRSSMSLNASCSSDASSDSSHTRASTGRMSRGSVTPVRRKQCGSMLEKTEKFVVQDSVLEPMFDATQAKKRCAWVTPNTDSCYATFHDEEWGVPVHNDGRLFELLSLSGALAELTWPAILNKRHVLREVFLDFDPFAVSKLNEKKIVGPGSPVCSLLSELKLRAIIENARQMCKVIDEIGSFDKYIWNCVNQKPIVNRFRYPRQVPVKTAKADVISKDLVRRGFRCVGPTVIYTFMQVAGLTNDHLISCFRFQDCIAAAEAGDKNDRLKTKVEEKLPDTMIDLRLARTEDLTDFTLLRPQETNNLELARAVDDLEIGIILKVIN